MTVAYSVPQEAKRLFETGILANPLIAKNLPEGALEASQAVHFEGSDAPSIPINWRFAESVAALKAYEATVLNVLLRRKYGVNARHVDINTDHAQLFFMSPVLWVLDPDGEKLDARALLSPELRPALSKYFKECNLHNADGSFYRSSTTNIYRTRDDRFFHLHGSMNPDPSLHALGLPSDMKFSSRAEACDHLNGAVGEKTAEEMQELMDEHRQAGTICWTTDEYRHSEHGRANAGVGLFEIHAHPEPSQKPCWWPDSARTSAARPLAGLKVVDLTRIIASPAITRGLAELGASVMRITAPHLTDMSALHPDLNHGKWNASLDLRQEADRQKLRALVAEADVFVQGYRPGVLEKYGFGEEGVLEIARSRGRGIIYCGENCYGWQGPWAHRSGWQQISDANCGVSYEFGRAMGLEEPVTPVFPNSDYCTGISGAIGVLTALLRRAEEGGSWTVSAALNYYSQWLVNSCGMYPPKVWQQVWQKHGSPVFHHFHSMSVTIPKVMESLEQNTNQLFRPEFFTQYHSGAVGKDIRIVAPVLRYADSEVRPGFDVGTRGNGVDQPKWPKNLEVETVQ